MSRPKELLRSNAVQELTDSISRQLQEFSRQTEELIESAVRDALKRGKRLAKGKSEFAKPRGRQKILNDIWALQFVDFVDAHLADGKTLGAVVEKYRDGMARFIRAEGISKDTLLDITVFEQDKHRARGALMSLYRRIKNGKHKIEAKNLEAYRLLEGLKSDT